MTKIENKLNLSAYFMLPFLKLTYTTFDINNDSNLENVYITTQMQVVVRVKNKEEVGYDYTTDINYVLDYDEDKLTTIVYQLPEAFEDDFLYYTKGMYFKMTSFAKEEIKKYSGLVYKKFVGNQDSFDKDGKLTGKASLYETHKFLRALDKEDILRSAIEKEFDVKLPKDAELLSKIGDENYIKL